MIELDEDLTTALAPRVLPPGWSRATHPSDPFNKWYTNDGMTIIASAEIINGKRWWHVSCARPARLPSWEDIRKVKAVFVGRDAAAVQVLPREDEYVNANPFCLHMWRWLDGDLTPDLRRDGTL